MLVLFCNSPDDVSTCDSDYSDKSTTPMLQLSVSFTLDSSRVESEILADRSARLIYNDER